MIGKSKLPIFASLNQNLIFTVMAVTRLQRKNRKNIARAKAYVKEISRLIAKPSLKSVDIEAIKKEFAEKKQSK